EEVLSEVPVLRDRRVDPLVLLGAGEDVGESPRNRPAPVARGTAHAGRLLGGLVHRGRQLLVDVAREHDHLPRRELGPLLVGRHVGAAAASFLHVTIAALHTERLRERLHGLEQLLARRVLRQDLQVLRRWLLLLLRLWFWR